MKRYDKMALFGLLVMFMGVSCSENYIEFNKGETVLALSADTSNVELDIISSYDPAITFSWTTGTNKGTNCAISYVFQMDLAGNNFAGGISAELGKRVYSLQYTHEQLNELLRESFNIVDGASASLEARIIAIPSDESVDEQISEVLTLNLKTFKPVSSTLYLIGDATLGGWTLAEATKMNSITGVVGGFVWAGKMQSGKFKLLTTNESLIPSYGRDASSSELKLLYRESESNPDEQFKIETPGSYRITVNIIDLTIMIEATSGPKYNKIYFVGSFTNWSFVEMRQDPANKYIFRYGNILTWNGGGEFKFGTAENSWSDMYHPTVANAPYSHMEVMQNSPTDNKWLVPEADCGKPYKMALDISEGSETFKMSVFVPYETLYMVGDATPSGWSVTEATPMTKVDDYNFTWTGRLTAGSMKITCDRRSDWNGAWFMSAVNDEEPTGSEQIMTFVDKINDPKMSDVDRKWKITSPGTYMITGNQLTETITFVKL